MFTHVYPSLPMVTLMFTQVCYFNYINSFASIYIAMCTCLPGSTKYSFIYGLISRHISFYEISLLLEN